MDAQDSSASALRTLGPESEKVSRPISLQHPAQINPLHISCTLSLICVGSSTHGLFAAVLPSSAALGPCSSARHFHAGHCVSGRSEASGGPAPGCAGWDHLSSPCPPPLSASGPHSLFITGSPELFASLEFQGTEIS